MPVLFLPRVAQLVSLENLIEILQKCRRIRSWAYSKNVIMYIYSSGLEAHRVIGNYLVPMLVEYGNLLQAEKSFNRLLHRKEHSWTSLIQAYAECGKSSRSLYLFEKMRQDNVCPSSYTFVAVLKACAKLKSMERGQEFHTEIAQEGLEIDFCIGSSLVHMYVKCGFLLEAQEIFNDLPIKDVITWTALIAGYAESGNTLVALKYLKQMQENGLHLDGNTFVCCLKGCGNPESLGIGQEIHHEIVKHGFEGDLIVANSLLDMYSKSGSLVEASAVFMDIEVKDVITWTSLISGYAEHGCSEEALTCYGRMQEDGVLSNNVTLICSLRACGNIKAINQGKEMHSLIFKRGLERDASISSALVAIYGRCQLFTEAHGTLRRQEVEDVVSWNALMSGYADHGLVEEAMKAFEIMQTKGLYPDSVTFICILKGCCRNKAIGSVRQLHIEIAKQGNENELTVGNALMDSYVKCGSLSEAEKVFNSLKVQDVISWTSLIAGYAFQGMSEIVFYLFQKMGEKGICPDAIALQSILTVCNHSGLVDKGYTYFEAISREYGETPTLSHHNAMVDALARAGQLEEVVEMLDKMPLQPDHVTWLSVLSACRKWGHVKLGEKAFINAVKLDEEDDAAFFLMYNIYLDAEMWEDAKRIETIKLKAADGIKDERVIEIHNVIQNI